MAAEVLIFCFELEIPCVSMRTVSGGAETNIYEAGRGQDVEGIENEEAIAGNFIMA